MQQGEMIMKLFKRRKQDKKSGFGATLVYEAAEKPLTYSEAAKLRTEIEKARRDMDFWHRQFKKYSFTQCLHCGKKLMIWPYGSVAYYNITSGDDHTIVGYVHSACYDDYLKEKRSGIRSN